MTTIPTTAAREMIERFELSQIMGGRGSTSTPLENLISNTVRRDPIVAVALLLREIEATDDHELAKKARTILLLTTTYQLRYHHTANDLDVPIAQLSKPFDRTEKMTEMATEAFDLRLLGVREYLSPKTARYVTTETVWSDDPDSMRTWEVAIDKPYWNTVSPRVTLEACILPELWFFGGLLGRIPEAREAMAKLRPYLIPGWTKLRMRLHPKDRDGQKHGAILVNEDGVEVGQYPLPERDPFYVEPVKEVQPTPKPSSRLQKLLDGREHRTHDLPGIGRVIVAAKGNEVRLIHYPLGVAVKVRMQIHPKSIFEGMTHIGGVSLQKTKQATLEAGCQGFVNLILPIPEHDEEDQLRLNYEIGVDSDDKLAEGELLVAQSALDDTVDRMAQHIATDEQETHNKGW